jgi:ribulose-5-phosphate 4-epimerase/fuculose-1-phosphate aldolase
MDGGGQSVRDRVSADEWQTRKDLAALYRLVALNGWDDLVFTHISMRIPGPDHHFLINPYGMLFDEITASSLVKVDLEGNIISPTSYFINPAGFTIHSAIHANRDDANVVIHLHTDDGVAVSAQKRGLLPITQTAMIILGTLAYHDYEGVALDLDERERLVRDIGTKNAMLLRNHGTLAVGHSAAAAYTRIFFLERACSMQIKAMSGGGELIECDAEMQAKVAGQGQMDKQNQLGDLLVWPGLLRRLDRVSPGYAD